VNKIKRDLGSDTPDIQFRVVPHGLELLQNGQNSFQLIQKCLDQWNLEINAEEEFNQMIKNAQICHGIISALTLLYVIDLMYQKYNPKRLYSDIFQVSSDIDWNQINFENDVIPACSAIYLHNLPPDRFSKAKIDPQKAPLPFLLKITDTLQEWERPSLDKLTGYSSEEFDIEFDNDNNLVFYANNKKIRDKIQSEISMTINNSKILIN